MSRICQSIDFFVTFCSYFAAVCLSIISKKLPESLLSREVFDFLTLFCLLFYSITGINITSLTLFTVKYPGFSREITFRLPVYDRIRSFGAIFIQPVFSGKLFKRHRLFKTMIYT